MKNFNRTALAAIAFILFFSVSATAQEAGKHSRLFLSTQTSGRPLPTLGVSQNIELDYRYYYSGSDNMLFRNNHIGFGVTDDISPATNSIGAFIEFEPVAVFNLRIEYDYLQYFGAFSAMLVFPDRNSDYSDDVLDDLDEDNAAVWGTGQRLAIHPTLQAMYWRIVLLNTLRFEWYDMNKDGYFYQPSEDTLFKTDEYFFANEAVLGFILRKKADNNMMILGTRYVYFRAENAAKQRQELDGVFVWMMGDKVWFMENPMLMAAAGGYMEDQYRESDVFVGGMFKFEYTLFPKK